MWLAMNYEMFHTFASQAHKTHFCSYQHNETRASVKSAAPRMISSYIPFYCLLLHYFISMFGSVVFTDTGAVLSFPHWRDVGGTAVPAQFYINVSYQINSLASETYFPHLPESLSRAPNACNCSRLDLYPPNQMWLLRRQLTRIHLKYKSTSPIVLSVSAFWCSQCSVGVCRFENCHICILNLMLNLDDSLTELQGNEPNTSLPADFPGTRANSRQ